MAKTVSYTRGTGTYSSYGKTLLYTAPSSGVTKMLMTEFAVVYDVNGDLGSNYNNGHQFGLVVIGNSGNGYGAVKARASMSYSSGGAAGYVWYPGDAAHSFPSYFSEDGSTSSYLYQGTPGALLGNRGIQTTNCIYNPDRGNLELSFRNWAMNAWWMTPSDKLYISRTSPSVTMSYSYSFVTINET